MSRAARLLDLLQLLRRHRRPVAGRALSDALGVSLRTLYRDIAALQAQGAEIVGEPGIGYQLRPGFVLPPLMFTEEQMEALVLGARWVGEHGDPCLAEGARDALAKIVAVLPTALRAAADDSPLLVGPARARFRTETVMEPASTTDGAAFATTLGAIRTAIRRERKLAIGYVDGAQALTARTIWPFALGFFEQARVVVAWCEAREDFRHFRLDRIESCAETGDRYPRRRQSLLSDWRARQRIDTA